jgi:hypothetical protein
MSSPGLSIRYGKLLPRIPNMRIQKYKQLHIFRKAIHMRVNVDEQRALG